MVELRRSIDRDCLELVVNGVVTRTWTSLDLVDAPNPAWLDATIRGAFNRAVEAL